MNGGGRQGLRSGGGATGVHHQRQYSENFLDGATTGNRWLQSAGLQHLQSSAANPLQVRFISFLILDIRDDLVKLMIILIWFDLMRLWLCNASRIITCTVAERREEECIGMFREALMAEGVIIIWSLHRLLMLTVLRRWRWTVMIRLVILVLACWICIRLILSFFLRLFLFLFLWYDIWFDRPYCTFEFEFILNVVVLGYAHCLQYVKFELVFGPNFDVELFICFYIWC